MHYHRRTVDDGTLDDGSVTGSKVFAFNIMDLDSTTGLRVDVYGETIFRYNFLRHILCVYKLDLFVNFSNKPTPKAPVVQSLKYIEASSQNNVAPVRAGRESNDNYFPEWAEICIIECGITI